VSVRSDREPETATEAGLEALERRVLAFERDCWRLDEPKDRAIRDRLGISAVRYRQLLNRTIDRPEALAADPVLVRRLRRLRDARWRSRVAGENAPARHDRERWAGRMAT
jgi:Protein of unknown function (DUF3263)